MELVQPAFKGRTPHDAPFDHEAALEACARGERFALQALYERESRWLLGVALRIVRDRERAHDVLQDAFLQIWQRAGTYQRSLGSGRGWVYTVVRHRALDEARRHQREVPMGDELEALHEAQSLQQALADAGPLDGLSLGRCMDRLEEAKRECIIHAFVDGYTHQQIAEQLSTPVGTVKSWIRRGLLSLKECLS